MALFAGAGRGGCARDGLVTYRGCWEGWWVMTGMGGRNGLVLGRYTAGRVAHCDIWIGRVVAWRWRADYWVMFQPSLMS